MKSYRNLSEFISCKIVRNKYIVFKGALFFSAINLRAYAAVFNVPALAVSRAVAFIDNSTAYNGGTFFNTGTAAINSNTSSGNLACADGRRSIDFQSGFLWRY